MKLISCHIENFGKLSNVDYSFGSGITEFCEENGSGKSTLAAFIKAMFYGLPSVRVGGKDFNDRKHFFPFDGKKFGGYLTFEMNGKTYRITRYFDKKSNTADELTVHCGSSPCFDLGTDIGRAVFGVDKESFERTIFITPEAIDICATSSISAKLNNFVDNSDSRNTYDDVYERLEKAKKRLKAARGEGGLINEQKRNIRDLKSEIGNIESLSEALRQQYEKANELSRAIEDGEKQIKASENINRELEHWEQYESMSLRLSEDEREFDEIRRRYPLGIPTSAEIDTIKESAGKITSLKGKREAAAFAGEKSSRLENLSGVFAEGVPSEKSMQSLQSDINRISELRVLTDNKRAEQKSERAQILAHKFGNKIPSGEEIAGIKSEIERYRELDARLKEQSDIATVNAPVKRKRTYGYLIAAILAAVIGIVGVVCLVAVNMILGGVMLVVGAIALVADGFAYLGGRKSSSDTITVNETTVKNKADMRLIEERVRAFLVPYGYYSQNGIIFDFATFENDLNDYLTIKNADNASEQELQAMCSEMEELIKRAKGFFSRYFADEDDLQKAYIKLQKVIEEYSGLKNDEKSARESQSQATAEIGADREKIENILKPYGIALQSDLSRQIDSLYRDAENMTRLNKDIEAKKKELLAYKNKYELTEKPIAEKCDTAPLEEKVSHSRNELAIISSRIAEDESAIERFEGRNSLQEAEDALSKMNSKYKMLDATMSLLKQAERNLKDRYIAPIKNNFLYYADIIESSLGEKMEMDENFNITFERGGEARSDKHLSAGQRSICSLCFRLALVNNMYEKEKPFIIMDDPFVNLDAEHIIKTIDTVKALAKDNQIIYFCCHDSRKISENGKL